MKKNTLRIIFIFVVIIFIFILLVFKNNHIENFYDSGPALSPSLYPEVREEMAKLEININKDNVKKYLEKQNKLKGNKFGYSILKNTNKDSVGFCPLGSFYNGKFNSKNIKNIDVFSKCKKCYKCNTKKGVYTSGGCIGDKDSVCKNLKDKTITHKNFIESHKQPFLLHSQLPKHKHYGPKEIIKFKDKNKNFWLEKNNHKHTNL